MIPSLFDKIKKRIEEKTKDKGKTLQTEILSYFENWVERADLLGEDQGEEKHDTKLLYRLFSLLNPTKNVIVVSNKYPDDTEINNLPLKNVWGYLVSKKSFSEYLSNNYGLDDGASY